MQVGEYQPSGSNWVFVLLLLGDMIQTFVLELIAAACALSTDCTNVTVVVPSSTNCTHELVCAPAIVATYVVSTVLFAIVPGFVYMIITCISGCGRNSALLSVVYANLGSILYYYGDNITN